MVEEGPALPVIRASTAEYTRLLLDALPNPFAQADAGEDRSAASRTASAPSTPPMT